VLLLDLFFWINKNVNINLFVFLDKESGVN